MKIILSKNCESLTGSIGRGFGYHIQRRHDRQGHTQFYGVRQSNGSVPIYGHKYFIFACAHLAQMKLHIVDIRVPSTELRDALIEARDFWALSYIEPNKVYNAAEIIQFEERMRL